MENNSTPVLNEVRKNILGYGIKNTFRSTQQFVEEICEDGYCYTKFEEDMQSFISEKEALKALKKTPDNRYRPEDFSVVRLYQYLREEDIVKAYLTCLKNGAFQIDAEEGSKVLSFKNGDNALSISFIEYDSDEEEYTSRETAGKNGHILMEDGFVFIYVHDPCQDFSICRLDNVEGFDELEKEATKLIKTTFNVK